MKSEFEHTPVMSREVIDYLNPRPGGVIMDLTVGGGGHSELILRQIGPSGRLLGIDKDPEALEEAADRLAPYKKQLALVKTDFCKVRQTLQNLGVETVDGILIDLGVSSHQLDLAERGFSYRHDGPLDMRMDIDGPVTAADILRTYSIDELTRVIRTYGEERWAARIAEFIVERRKTAPLETTFDLVSTIKDAVPAGARKKGGPHPARRTFQAIRIEVNRELEALEVALREGIESLSEKGRIVVISYHSLEDRIVKQTFKEYAEETDLDSGARLIILTKKPIRPTADEAVENPRAESAKLRAAEKI